MSRKRTGCVLRGCNFANNRANCRSLTCQGVSVCNTRPILRENVFSIANFASNSNGRFCQLSASVRASSCYICFIPGARRALASRGNSRGAMCSGYNSNVTICAIRICSPRGIICRRKGTHPIFCTMRNAAVSFAILTPTRNDD